MEEKNRKNVDSLRFQLGNGLAVCFDHGRRNSVVGEDIGSDFFEDVTGCEVTEDTS